MGKLTKEDIKEVVPQLIKFIEEADEVNFSIDAGIFELPTQGSRWVEKAYDGHTSITFNVYHKKRDGRKELLERISG